MKMLPTLEAAHVILRPLDADDADIMHDIFQSPEVRRLTGSQQEVTLEQVRVWYASLQDKDDRADFGIILKDSGELIGEAVLNQIDSVNRLANFRILLDAERYAGRGYGTEATSMAVRFGFEQLNLNRIELGVYAFNAKAKRVYEKVGFVQEGVRREVLWRDGQAYDEVIMGLLRRDFLDRQ